MRSRKCLAAAVTSTIAAVVWLINCVIDRTMGLTIAETGASGILLTAVWSVSALCWWLAWRRERRTAEE